jgi:hypothetical protein
MRLKVPEPIPCAIVLWCGWKSRGLLRSWIETPFDELAWLAFLIWALAPLTSKDLPTVLGPEQNKPTYDRPLLYGAVILTIVGQLADLRLCFHLSLMLAIAGALLPMVNLRSFIWISSAVCWMPAFGWFFRHNDEHAVTLIRMAIAATGLLAIHSHRFAFRLLQRKEVL